jgi:hypothetical protein
MTDAHVPDTDRLDTHIDEPSFTAGEIEMLVFALERSRAQFAWKVGGLGDEQLHRRVFPSSTITLGGLLKHLALCEDSKVAEFVTGTPLSEPWASVEGMSVWEWCWRSSADDSATVLYAQWTAAVERARAAWSAAIADGGLDRPAAYVFRDGTSPNLRRILVDLHDEYARHVGHADLLREAIDGLAGEDPPQD